MREHTTRTVHGFGKTNEGEKNTPQVGEIQNGIIGTGAGSPLGNSSNTFFGWPIFIAENGFPEIQKIDREYYNTFAPPSQRVMILNQKYLLFRYEADQAQQKLNGYAATKANPQCADDRVSGQHCHEVPYKSTQEGGAGAIKRPADANQNTLHGNALMQFYKTLKDGDYFLVPVGEEEKIRIPQPRLEPVDRKVKDPSKEPVVRPRTPIPIIPILVESEEAFEVGELIWFLILL